MRKTLFDEPSVQTFLSLAQLRTGQTIVPELSRAESPEDVLERTLQVAPAHAEQIKDAYEKCFPKTEKPRPQHVSICDVVITTESHQAKPPPRMQPPPPIPRRDPIEIWFQRLDDVAFVLFFNDQDVEKGQPALMGGQKLCDVDGANVAIDKCRLPEGYEFSWGTLGPQDKLGYFKEENPREFGSGDPTIAVALDRQGNFLSSFAYSRPTNRHIIKVFERKADGTPDDTNEDGTPKPPVEVQPAQEGEHLDTRNVKFDEKKIEFHALFKKDYSPSNFLGDQLRPEDVKIFMGLADGLMGEVGAQATLTFPVGQQPIAVSTGVGKRDVEVKAFPPKVKGSPSAFTEIKPANMNLDQLLRTQLAFSCWASTFNNGGRYGDQQDQQLPLAKFLYPDQERVTIGGTKLSDSITNHQQVTALAAETAAQQNVRLDRVPCSKHDDNDDRLDGPRFETHRIHLPEGFLSADGASLKGWQIEVGYRNEQNKWVPNVQRISLPAGKSSQATTLELDVEYPRAIRRRGGQAIELRIYAPNGAPAKAYSLPLQAFSYDPAIVST